MGKVWCPTSLSLHSYYTTKRMTTQDHLESSHVPGRRWITPQVVCGIGDMGSVSVGSLLRSATDRQAGAGSASWAWNKGRGRSCKVDSICGERERSQFNDERGASALQVCFLKAPKKFDNGSKWKIGDCN